MDNKIFQSEEAIITEIRKDNNNVLAHLYKSHFPMILYFISSNNGSEQEAKDIYQEAFILLYEKLKDKSFELNCQIKTFLYAVARRLWLKQLAAKNKVLGRVENFEDTLALDIDLDEEENKWTESEQQHVVMQTALKQLGEPCKTILEDFYIKKLSMQQITENMGYTNTDNAKNQKYKCLMRLKKLFFNQYK